jgi:hypothetical protein
VGEGGASRSEAPGEGFLRLDELCENVLQDARRLLQDVVIPVTRDLKTFGRQYGLSLRVVLRQCVLTTIDFDDYAFFKAYEIQNEILKWDLTPKFKDRKASVSKQPPHRRLSVGRVAAHLLCEIADAFGDRPVVSHMRQGPLTRRLTSLGATLSHRGRGKINPREIQGVFYTRIGIST